MCLDKATENTKISFDGNTYVNSKEEKILGIVIDNDLFFDSHKGSVSKAFPKTSSVISLSKLFRSEREKIFNFLIKPQFTYCPLVWVFCSLTSNNLIKLTNASQGYNEDLFLLSS